MILGLGDMTFFTSKSMGYELMLVIMAFTASCRVVCCWPKNGLVRLVEKPAGFG
jgi:hypothetical protein